jgi:hypothetical protein
MKKIIKKPLAWLPLAISGANLFLLLDYLAFFGNVHHEDEGAPAHIFQLLTAIEVFIIIFFVIKWLPKKPKEVIKVLVLQIVAVLIPLSIVFFLEK